MIRMSKLIVPGLDTPLDMILPAGMSAILVTAREQESSLLIRLLLGFTPPEGGELVVCDSLPSSLSESQLIEFRRKIGVIYHDGGLVSNLNIWDNLTLQLAYHTPMRRQELEDRGREAIARVGYTGSLTVLPSRLTMYQRRLIAFARALLVEPDLMIYQAPLDGLSHGEERHFLDLMQEYHQKGIDRTALFLTAYPEAFRDFSFDFTYSTGGTSAP
jgi:phospholipid/cholesterol/gamma-HCH transport system ATP-binding protein